jgi:hypothetical protein
LKKAETVLSFQKRKYTKTVACRKLFPSTPANCNIPKCAMNAFSRPGNKSNVSKIAIKINKFVFFGKTLYKRKYLCYNLTCENSAAQPADIRFFQKRFTRRPLRCPNAEIFL